MAFQKPQFGKPRLSKLTKTMWFLFLIYDVLNWPYVMPCLKTSLWPVLSYRRINSHNKGLDVWTHHVHVDAVGVGPRVLEILLQPLSERVWDLVESDELFHTEHLRVVPRRSRIQPLDDGRDVPKNAGVHQSWRGQDSGTQMKANARYISLRRPI